ncbi:hypothetical protein [Paenibacillus sp. OV219]|uniref:hypothetical protein n=1 Tax=Paenibacillus sp. OV219 TaxID=1884377 RepID=UPI0008C97627|nr:hypothetical protein [Paenibacillus sp. OV219]SEO55604.1 hypothetical protein SAMN05518847_108241 [Paenibacillus sp. OV219]
MGLQLRYVLPAFQLLLTAISVCIDQSIQHGLGEGDNQVSANLVSNVEFLFKQLLGFDDIVSYHFRLLTVVMAVGVWYGVGLAADKMIQRFRSG